MRMRTRAIAIAAAVAALVAPATVAHADPVYTLSVASTEDVVYPVVDGWVDDTTIAGAIASPTPERVRAAVIVSVGTRIAKTWLLSSTGPFSFAWDGKIGTSIVAGSYTVTLRVDGETSVTDTFSVSAKKLTALTWTKTVKAAQYGGCDDEKTVPIDQWLTYDLKICPRPFSGSSITLDGKKAVGVLTFGACYIPTPSAVRNSLLPQVASVSLKVVQSGSGGNQLSINPGSGVPPSSVKTFTKSGTYSVSHTFDSTPFEDLCWDLALQHGHKLTLTTYTFKVKYWVLR